MVWYIFCYNSTSRYHAVLSDVNTRKDYGISSNPNIIADGNRCCTDTLFVNALFLVFEVVIECCHSNTLCQVDMITYGNRTDNRVMQSNPCIVAYDNIPNGIVDTDKRLNHGIVPKPELAIGWSVHSYRTVDDTVLPPMLI